MTTTALLDALRVAPADTDQLAALVGCRPATVRSAVRRLQRRGYVLANETGRSGGRGCRARYRLVYDPEHPVRRRCAWDGCGARLASDNTGRFCSVHASKLEALTGGRF